MYTLHFFHTVSFYSLFHEIKEELEWSFFLRWGLPGGRVSLELVTVGHANDESRLERCGRSPLGGRFDR